MNKEKRKLREKKIARLRRSGQLDNYINQKSESSKNKQTINALKSPTNDFQGISSSKMPEQIKNRFDKETLIKILKGMLIAFTGAGTLALLNYLGALKFDNPVLVSAIAWLVPVLVNIVKEYLKGEKV